MKHFIAKHVFIILALAAQGANTADTIYTARNMSRGGRIYYESNPLARPVVDLPRPAYIATSESMAAGASLLGWKMKHSEKKFVRKIWWLPQTVAISGNTFGAVYSARH